LTGVMDKKGEADQTGGEILWPDLTKGRLIKRYKRFLADVRLDNDEIVTCHCANSGAMLECCEPGREVYLSFQNSSKRRLKYTWEIIRMDTSIVGVNTNIPNRLVKKSIEHNLIQELDNYDSVKSEVKVSDHSRLDLMLTGSHRRNCFVEVKNCTLVQDGLAAFPDAVTTRGLKHLVELQRLIKQGNRCVMFYLIQRMDAKSFSPADNIDPAYGDELRQAEKNGVEIRVYDTIIDLKKIKLGKAILLQM